MPNSLDRLFNLDFTGLLAIELIPGVGLITGYCVVLFVLSLFEVPKRACNKEGRLFLDMRGTAC